MILVLRALGIGDLVTAVPALRGLRAAYPAMTLTLAAPAGLAALIDLIGVVDRLVPTVGLEPVRWLDAPPDWAVNLHGRGPQSHQVLRATRPGRLWAYACPAADHDDGPTWRDDEHEVLRWCRLLTWYGVECDPTDLTLPRPPPDRVPVGVTVLHPGAASARRRWPADRFGVLARRLTDAGHRVVITGSPGERTLAEAVAAVADLPGTAVYAGRMDLFRFSALLSHARLLVSGDTGAGHLATAFGVPSVLLFGPTSPARWGPLIDREIHQVLQYPALSEGTEEPADADGYAEPADAVPHPALAAICVDEVLAAIGEVQRGAAATQ
ncbi:glycosyltransferase family 9 protein [Solwaraspora sp. WMMD406]|uniref:glycosyltransferase family 9 protein n=1 Tax=Solwaraspora sp. WMMD406 TaxID=3016095 RepID=UPI002415DF78|nr:glycosyltransferase family 9 protein [Solwaraspora sp. WMMD406]MDG4766596.1 glycosyltransferase family 9 protein [Solwaraspora sp. WMMD406]